MILIDIYKILGDQFNEAKYYSLKLISVIVESLCKFIYRRTRNRRKIIVMNMFKYVIIAFISFVKWNISSFMECIRYGSNIYFFRTIELRVVIVFSCNIVRYYSSFIIKCVNVAYRIVLLFGSKTIFFIAILLFEFFIFFM